MMNGPAPVTMPDSGSLLARGNRALAKGRSEEAIRLYVEALGTMRAFGGLLAGNLAIARHRRMAERARAERPRIAVCGWDLAHNAAGRVYMLARLYGAFSDVEILGALFPHYGTEVWGPIRGVSIPIHVFRVDAESAFLDRALELVLAHPYDLVHVCKPRAPTVFFAALYRLIWGSRIVLDIDDDELAFVGNVSAQSPWDHTREHGGMPPLARLDGPDWTRLAVGMVPHFDAVTVANAALQARFGGVLVRHARDETIEPPGPQRRAELRARMGIAPHQKVVVFLGTPREHKGLLDVALALQSLARDDLVFVVIGSFADEHLKARLLAIGGVHYLFFENQPFERIHELAAVGDACVLMQDPESPVSRAQTPAKLSDALAAGVVVLATSTAGIADLLDAGAILTVTRETLAATLDTVLRDASVAASLMTRGRELFLTRLSFSANAPAVRQLVREQLSATDDRFGHALQDCPFVTATPLAFLQSSSWPSQQARAALPEVLKPPPPNAPTVAKEPPAAPAPPAATARKLPITVLVVTWDVGHNPLGRSYMLAEAIERVARNVVLTGFQFPRYGDDVWEPVRDGRLPVVALPGTDWPGFLATLDTVCERIRPDVVVACKPRLPSMLLGLKLKARWGCPLIVDIDDHELSFFRNSTPLSLDQLGSLSPAAGRDLAEPYGELWTRLSHTLCEFGDELLVSNVALQREFGGTIVPHVRDERLFDPAGHDRATSRRRYGIPESARVVLFFGTPRLHKGVDALARAVGQMADPQTRLVIVGTAPDRSVTAKLESLAPGRVTLLPNQPFRDVPAVLAMADVVCLPQDEGHAISQFQLPAKAIDAVGMGIPLLVTRTPPLMQLVDDGVAVPVDREGLAAAIEAVWTSPTGLADWQHRTRPVFLAKYSYQAAGGGLRQVMQRALANRARRDPAAAIASVEQAIGRLACAPARRVGEAPRGAGVDVVLFWKQNDTGLYGRRHDMVIKYLASRADVRKVLVFDAPLSEGDLIRRRDAAGPLTQDRLIYVRTYEKLLGKLDSAKVRYNVFVHPPGAFKGETRDAVLAQLLVGYRSYLEQVFRREGVTPSESIFWIYPKNDLAPALIDHFRPMKTVVDVVDDHRAWPGTSDAEKARLTTNYRETLARADMAFVNCEPVRQSMSVFHPQIRLVPNGCDLDPPAVPPRHSPEFDTFMAWTGPTIGFVGNLEAKIDIELLEKVARRFADAQLVLLGSTHANPAARRLAALPNVRMPGVVPYEQVGAWLAKFDVGLIPHLDIEMTRSMNPLKLYVYLAARVPVVTTEVMNVATESRLVHVGRTHDEFLHHVAACLGNGRVQDGLELTYIAMNSWAARFGPHVDQLLSRTGPMHTAPATTEPR